MTGCPSDNELQAWLDGRFDTERAAGARAHVSNCASCRAALGALAEPENLGRYRLLSRLGGGEMGVVYAAEDPDLGRRVALKLVRTDVFGEQAERLRARLLRESQAMAKLAHPNVVAVYDVGISGDQVFVAMELVEGPTLRAWLDQTPRTRTEILQAFLQAGQGLAAAHAAGVVHRDFKPDNVLIGHDGRVRVGDFGLAAALDERAEPGEIARGDVKLTRTGAAMGTPAYMAPEQWQGQPSDARTDVFAFAVALYEAISGVRPFAGLTIEEVRRATMAGVVQNGPRRVPARLRRVLVRALAADPAERHASMEELRRAIEPRSFVRGAAAVAAVLLVAALVTVTRPQCTGAASEWGSTWGAADKDRVRAAFLATGKSYAPRAFERVDAALQAAREAWVRSRIDSCQRADDKRDACLVQRRGEIVSVVEALARADVALIERAPSVLWELSRFDDCTPHTNPEMESAQSEARVKHLVGDYHGALAAANRGLAMAGQDGRWQAIFLVQRGRNEEEQFRYKDAEQTYQLAVRGAFQRHDDAICVDAWTRLVSVVGYRQERADEAHVYANYAQAALDNLDDPWRQAQLLGALATVEWWTEARLEEAAEHYKKGRALIADTNAIEATQFLVEEHTGVLHDMGLDERALPYALAAARQIEKNLGRDHVDYYYAAANYAEHLLYVGKLDEAEALLRDVVARFPLVREGFAAHRLALALRLRGDGKGALVFDRRALDALGEQESLDAAFAFTGLGEDYLLLGDPKSALGPLEKASRIRERAKLSTLRAETDFALARALGDGERASNLARSALRAFEEARGRYGSAHYQRKAREVAQWLSN